MLALRQLLLSRATGSRVQSRLTHAGGASDLFVYSCEVQDAVRRGDKPLVALESTIITHGMAHPHNLHTARLVEDTIRDNGAVPATIAILDGRIHIGLDSAQLERLSLLNRQSVTKTSRRDLAPVLAQRGHGATTVSGTMLLAHKAGIDVFVTGGLGGVHRGAESTMDISADLTELGRTPVAVVCAGVKSILDIGRTLEYLVCVTIATLGGSGEFPAFYTGQSGYQSPYHLKSVQQYQNRRLDLSSGSVIAAPIPDKDAAQAASVNAAIAQALKEADQKHIIGKDVTPFLLGRVAELTHGKSLEANIALIKNNAKVGAQIARELHALKTTSASLHLTTSTLVTDEIARPVIIGCSALDVVSFLPPSKHGLQHLIDSRTSHPGTARHALGGVGRNIFEACSRALSHTPADTASLTTAATAPPAPAAPEAVTPIFVSAVGADYAGALLVNEMQRIGLDTSTVHQIPEARTAVYNAMHEHSGDLAVAVADMEINDKWDPAIVRSLLESANTSIVAFDGNLSPPIIKLIADESHRRGIPAFFEPTSVPKSVRVLHNLSNVTSGAVRYCSPNEYEVEAMAREVAVVFADKQLGTARTAVASALEESDVPPLVLEAVANAVTVSQVVPCIFLKLGQFGAIYLERLHLSPEGIATARQQFQSSLWDAHWHVSASGGVAYLIGWSRPQAVVEHPVSVNGAGDSFVGTVVAGLAVHGHSYDQLCHIVAAGRRAAELTLQSPLAVSPHISRVAVGL
ncbi:hypothetical protein RI367_006537 [Sorochytrium milnesiophthora]